MVKPHIVQRLSAGLKHYTSGRHNLPSDSEIKNAVRKLRTREPFCRLEGHGGNEGFSISLSFNPVTHQSGSDFIEIALRRAKLRFVPRRGQGWNWADSLKAFVMAAVETIVVRQLEQNSGTRGSDVTGRSEIYAEGEVAAPFTKVRGGAKLGSDVRAQSSSTKTEGLETTRNRVERYAEMHRSDTHFELTLDSPPQSDLVRLNSELDRIGVLSPAEPGAMKLDDVDVTLLMRVRDEGEHALRIRDAGGSWQRLKEHRNKEVVAEIYLSKFLRPAHQPLRLWPRKSP